jgi:hypothetical protein
MLDNSNYIALSSTIEINVLDPCEKDFAVVLGIGKTPWVIPKKAGSYCRMMSDYGAEKLVLLAEENEQNTLYYKTAETEIKIPGVNIYSHELSQIGDVFAYVKKDSETGENTLYLRHGNEEKEIFRGVTDINEVKLSPNGSAVGITNYYGERCEHCKSYLIIGDKTEAFPDDAFFWGIADNGKYVYYNENGNVYLQSGFDFENRKLIVKKTSGFVVIPEFNYDYSQAYFYTPNEDGDIATLIIKNGGEPIKIADEELHYKYNENVNYWIQVKDFAIGEWLTADEWHNYCDSFPNDIVFSGSGEILYKIEGRKIYHYSGDNREIICELETDLSDEEIYQSDIRKSRNGCIIATLWYDPINEFSEIFISKDGEEFVNIEMLK